MSEEPLPVDPGVKPATLGERAFCIKCGYQLSGLPEEGACPECGEEYDESTLARQPAPSAVEVILRFGWPIVAYVSSLLLMLTPLLDSDFGMFYLFTVVPALLLACFINVPVQYRILRRRGAPAPRDGDRTAGQLMLIMSVISIIGPFVIFGGCLKLIF